VRAYADAGIDPADVDLVEAHGTGTGIDAVELTALSDVLAGGGDRRPCLVGSVKSNIGHCEAAAGLAGLVKAVLCLEHGTVPPSLHHTRPRPDVDWTAVPLTVPTVPTPLPATGRPAVAAVNGQGMTGCNTHLVLTAATPAERPGGTPVVRTPRTWALTRHWLPASVPVQPSVLASRQADAQ
jgi:3-oxoacyl-[acyl-carrier-protein] synthase II